MLDFSATYHIIFDYNEFQNLISVQISISIANEATMNAKEKGDILLNYQLESKINQVVLKKILYISEMESSELVSVDSIQAAGGMVSFAGNTVTMIYEGKVYGIVRLQHNVYIPQTMDLIVVNAIENVIV